MLNYQGKVVLVTGSGMGLGRITAQRFAERGAKVVLADIDAAANEETLALIRKAGGTATAVRVDVTDESTVKAAVDRALSEYGGLDVAVNNAGIDQPVKPFLEQDDATFRRIMDVNVRGVWLCMRHELPPMVAKGRGAIVNVSSAADTMGSPMMPFYTASKHAVLGLTKSTGTEFAAKGIRINAVSPGSMRTPMLEKVMERVPGAAQAAVMTPIARIADPREVADAILFLGSDEASFVIGHSLKVDGGMSVW